MGYLKKYSTAGDTAVVSLICPATVAYLIEYLQIKPDEVGLIIVNGEHASCEALIPGGAEVKLFPVLTGG